MPGNLYANGIGGTLGDQLVTRKPLYMSGAVWYVDSTNGTDAAAPAGKNRGKPLKTLGQAVTNASNDDIIVLFDGFAETFTAAVTLSKRLLIIGEGSSGGKPTCKLTLNAAAANLFTITSDGVELRNLWIEENSQTNATARIDIGSAGGVRIVGCYIECGANDTGPALEISDAAGDYARIENTTFISTATAADSQPLEAMKVSAAASFLSIVDSTFDDGTYGFSNVYALNIASTVEGLRIENLSLLNGADGVVETASTGHINPQTLTGGGRIEWP